MDEDEIKDLIEEYTGLKVYRREYKYQFNFNLRYELRQYATRKAHINHAKKRLKACGFEIGDMVMARIKTEWGGSFHFIGTVDVSMDSLWCNRPISVTNGETTHWLSFDFRPGDIRMPKTGMVQDGSKN